MPVLEVVRARYGAATHCVFIVFCCFTNILVTAMLLTGGAGVVEFLTGAPTAATVFLFPMGVVIYTLYGGIKATFITDYINTLAIAASPVDALPGYVMGGLSWFAVPWVTATCMGLAGLALEGYDVWPTYPERLAAADVSAGLVLPNTAVALLGKSGAVATLIMAVWALSCAPFPGL